MPLDRWDFWDVTDWETTAQEQRGKREKFWVTDSYNHQWLRKLPHQGRPFETVIETSVLRLARAVGLPAPESHSCVWRESPSGSTRRGIVVRSFIQEPQELAMGSNVLRGLQSDYNPERHEDHTLERIRRALESMDAGGASALLNAFMDLVIFDAWTGNSDRHQENWGLIRASGHPDILAEAYDMAACLGAELLDANVLLGGRAEQNVRLDEYIKRCRSGFGDGQSKKMRLQKSIVAELGGWPKWQARWTYWRPRFEAALPEALDYFTSIDAEWLPEPRKAFAKELLKRRLQWLKEQA